MADKLVWVRGRLHKETTDKPVFINGRLHKETVVVATTTLNNDLVSPMYFQRHYSPIAMGE